MIRKNIRIEDRIKAHDPDEFYDIKMQGIENVSKKDINEYYLGYEDISGYMPHQHSIDLTFCSQQKCIKKYQN